MRKRVIVVLAVMLSFVWACSSKKKQDEPAPDTAKTKSDNNTATPADNTQKAPPPRKHKSIPLPVPRLLPGKDLYSDDLPEHATVRMGTVRDGKRLAVATRRKIRFWDLATGKTVLDIDGAQLTTRVMAFSKDGSRLAWAEYGGSVRIIDAKMGVTLLPAAELRDRPETDAVKRANVMAQVGQLHALLRRRGVTLVKPRSQRDAFCQVFTRDPSFVIGDMAFVGGLRDDYRLVETDGVIPRRALHLDCCLAPLPDGGALIAEDKLGREAIELLQEHFTQLQPVDRREARVQLAANLLWLDPQNVVANTNTPRTNELLDAAGYMVHALDYADLIACWGSFGCTVCPLVRG